MGAVLEQFSKGFWVFVIALAMWFSPPAARSDVPMTQLINSVSIGASLDTTYQYIFGCEKEEGNCPSERGLYPEHNDFSIDAFTISLEKQPDAAGPSAMDKVGFRADILFGEQAERLGFGFNSHTDGAVSPYQAYLNIAPAEGFNIYAGQFTTLAGWELIEAKDNTNISRSLLFYRIPFAHTGARVSYAGTGGFGLTLGISNDWDATDDSNDGKTFEAQASYSHSPEAGAINDLWLGATLYSGDTGVRFVDTSDNELYASASKQRTLLTLVGSVTSGGFTFVADAEFTWIESSEFEADGEQFNESPFRWGIGGYAIFQATPNTTFALRAEYVDDSDFGDSVKLFEITPTLAWKPFGQSEMGTFETRLEYRLDRADEKYFPMENGELERNQHALLFQLLYWI